MLSISFITTLSITCFAIYLADVAKEEMFGIFAAIIALLGFFSSLILAPWFIQVFILILVVVFWRELDPI